MDTQPRHAGQYQSSFADVVTVGLKGRVAQVAGTIIRAMVPGVRVGELCLLRNPGESLELLAEVVGLDNDAALLAPLGDMDGIGVQTEVVATGRPHMIHAGRSMLGRIVDGLGRPLDEAEHGPLPGQPSQPVVAPPPTPLARRLIDKPLALGVRVLDAAVTCGEGQRMGIFAAAGVGKSTLLSMLVRRADVDVTVVGLIGERGREVREFIEHALGPEGLSRSVVVCATSDRSPMERVKAAHVATAIAENFRDEGKRVLLLVDSVTRFARALREIGLAAGEPPTRRGFPPSVFAALPRLMERAGMSDKGSLTAFYTVLVEGDDMTEPVADETRSILDGHIVLSRKLAEANQYPAVDVLASTSRVMKNVVTPEHDANAGRLRELVSLYSEVELLVRIGEYQFGNDPRTDEAVDKQRAIRNFLRQGIDEEAPMDATLDQLDQLVG
jgi:type III secretion protein N (ATPase)